jgi:thiol-disulfide isomerase/thioredoxin
MKVIFLFLLLIYQTNIITCEEENKDLKFNPDEILILNDNTYEKEIKDNENILILAYAPWCHYCKSFEQIYLLLNKKVKEENLNYKISVIDATENTKFSNEYDIKSYPTLVFIIKNGNETFIYNSERTIDSILRFMHKKVYNSFYELKTNEEVNKFYSEKKVLLLSTYPKETKENEIFIELSKLNNDLEYVICNSEDCINKYNKDIILLKNYDEEIIKLSEIEFLKSKEFSINLLNKLLGSFLYKLGDMFNDKYIDYIFNNNKSSIFYVRNSKNEKETINDKIIIELGKEL